MKNGIYKIEFEKSSEDLVEDYIRLSEHEKDIIFEMDALGYFDYDTDVYNCLVITNPLDLDKYLNILDRNSIKTKIEDITKSVLLFETQLEIYLSDYITDENSTKWEFFSEDIREWLLDNLTIDMILDRISKVGLKSLSDIEIDFLENYQI